MEVPRYEMVETDQRIILFDGRMEDGFLVRAWDKNDNDPGSRWRAIDYGAWLNSDSGRITSVIGPSNSL